MRDAALHLAVDDHRIDDVAAVVRDRVVDECDAAGQRVDLDLDDVRAVAVGRLLRREVGGVLKSWRLAGREREARHALGDPRKLAERHGRLVAAAGGGAAVLDVDLGFRHAEARARRA